MQKMILFVQFSKKKEVLIFYLEGECSQFFKFNIFFEELVHTHTQSVSELPTNVSPRDF